MKVGLGSYALDWSIGVPGSIPRNPMNVFSFLEFADSLGVEVVQIADNLPLHTLPAEQRAELKAAAGSAGILIEVGIRGIQPENLERYIGIASELDAPILRAVIDAKDFRPSIPEAASILKDASDLLEQHGVTLALENHDRFKAREFVEILELAGSPRVGICLDTVNSFGALEGPDVVIDTLIDHVVNLHIKDFRIYRPPHNMGFIVEGTPAGDGMFDIPGVLRLLRAKRPDCSVILELWPKPEETPEQTAEKEQDWARKSIRYLKQIVG